MISKKFKIDISLNELQNIIGPSGVNIRDIENISSTEIEIQQDFVYISGESLDDIKKTYNLIKTLFELIKKSPNYDLNSNDINKYWSNLDISTTSVSKKIFSEDNKQLFKDIIAIDSKGNNIYPKSFGQKNYYNILKEKDVIFCTGPAGSGKTFLAISYAINEYRKGNFKKIILCRPAIEAGEELGFLPGSMKEKIDPYLIPLYDSLYLLLGKTLADKLINRGDFEIAPLAYMRGRTFNNSFMILDEAQNTNKMQIKMFLTRLGFDSKMVITGDIEQIDIKYQSSGIINAIGILKNIPEIGFVKLTSRDINRHRMVKLIVEAYEKHK